MGLDLTNIMDMVAFLRKLLDERARLEKKEVGKHRMTSVQMTVEGARKYVTLFIDMMP